MWRCKDPSEFEAWKGSKNHKGAKIDEIEA
jgi:hypothetical protein